MSFGASGTPKGGCLCSFDPSPRTMEAKPRFRTGAVLTLQLKVESALEPS